MCYLAFDDISKLPPNLIPSSHQVNKFAGAHVEDDQDSRIFNWQSFLGAVNNYPGDELTFDTFKDNRIAHGDSNINVVADKAVDFIRHVLYAISAPERR